mgnify:CR=1 FL=1
MFLSNFDMCLTHVAQSGSGIRNRAVRVLHTSDSIDTFY